MATAYNEAYTPEGNWGHTLFSKQFCRQLIIKIVRIDSVVQKFIDSKIISEAERKALCNKKLADKKLRYLLTLITEYCNKSDLQAFKTFIDVLENTDNIDISQQLSLIYKERVDYVAILGQLLTEKALVRDMENKISHLQRNLEEKERYCRSLTDENNTLVDQDETFRKEKLSLEKQIKIKDEDLLVVEKEMGELTRIKNGLEYEVNVKSNVIRKRDKEIVEKEKELWDAIEESDELRRKIDTLQQQQQQQQQHNEAMVEDREELSKKIEILKDEIAEKENTIMDLRENKSITRKEIEEEFRNIIKAQEKKMDDQTAMIKQQNEKFDDQTSMMKQQNEQIDDLKKVQVASARQQNENIDALRKAQMASAKEQTEAFGMIISALKIQEKK